MKKIIILTAVACTLLLSSCNRRSTCPAYADAAKQTAITPKNA